MRIAVARNFEELPDRPEAALATMWAIARIAGKKR
jgi:hypothetical protein